MTGSPLRFVGSWRLDRVIEDRLGGEPIRVAGATEISRSADGRLRWAEQGTLRRGELELPVSRVLYVEDDAGTWTVTFADGRPFHPWVLGEPVVHLCGPDRYLGRIDAEEDPTGSWTVTWWVEGPEKSYTSTSLLSPVPGS